MHKLAKLCVPWVGAICNPCIGKSFGKSKVGAVELPTSVMAIMSIMFDVIVILRGCVQVCGYFMHVCVCCPC